MILVDNGSELLAEAQSTATAAQSVRDIERYDRAMGKIDRVRIALDNIQGESAGQVELRMASAIMASARRDLGMENAPALSLEDSTAGSLGGYLKDALVATGRAVAKLISAVWDLLRRLMGRISMSSSRFGKTIKYFEKVIGSGRRTMDMSSIEPGSPEMIKFTRLLAKKSTNFSLSAVVREIDDSTKYMKSLLDETGAITDSTLELRRDQKLEFVLSELAHSMDRFVRGSPVRDSDDAGQFCGYRSSLYTGFETKTYYAQISHSQALSQSVFSSVKTEEVATDAAGRPDKINETSITSRDFENAKQIARMCADLNSVEGPKTNALFSKLERVSAKLLHDLNKASPEDEELFRASYMATRFIVNNYVKTLLTLVRHTNSIVEDVDAVMNVFCHKAH